MHHFLLGELVVRLQSVASLEDALSRTEPEWRESHLMVVSTELELLCRKMGLSTFGERAQLVRDCLQLQSRLAGSSDPNWHFTEQDAVERLLRLGEELRRYVDQAFAVPISPDHNHLLLPEDARIINAFPATAGYLSKAGESVTVELWQASVYYSMLALEMLLSVLAGRFKIKTATLQWSAVISQIEEAIKRIAPSHGKQWRERRETYSALALEFRFLKDAWRNRCMHLREVYNERSAMRILEHCRSLALQMALSGFAERRTKD